jgi:hypothetical protein
MHAKLFAELGVEVGSRLALISTQLNAHARLSHGLFLSLMAHLD